MAIESKATEAGKAWKNRTAFRMECGVKNTINASPEKIWAVLTDASRYPLWNSTIVSIEGTIAPGNTIKLKVKLDPKRTFKLKIGEFEPGKKMTWSDGMAPMFKGVRTYELTGRADGATDFSMVEVFSGIMLPMIAGALPDFRPAFEQLAADLKNEAEK